MSTEIPNNIEPKGHEINPKIFDIQERIAELLNSIDQKPEDYKIVENKLELEDVERELAEKAAEDLGINLDELLEYFKRFSKDSSPTYIIRDKQ